MTTEVTITGIGCPIPTATSAGPGVLVRYHHGASGQSSGEGQSLALQFDAGRSTVMRLLGAGARLGVLDAVFLTHRHSDHLTGLQDLVLTRWIMDRRGVIDPLPIVCPDGPAASFVERMLDAWDNDVAVRQEHTGRRDDPAIDLEYKLDPLAGTGLGGDAGGDGYGRRQHRSGQQRSNMFNAHHLAAPGM